MKHLIIFSALLFISIQLQAQTDPCQPPTAFTTLEVNNVRAGLLNGGDLWWDLSQARYEVPKGSGIHSLFGGGFWIGGIDAGGQLRVAAQTYRQSGTDYWPGPMGVPDAATEDVCLDYDRFWRVNQSEIDQFDQLSQQHLSTGDSIPLHLIPNSIRDWPAAGNPYARGKGNVPLQIPVSKDLAPYVDVDGNPGYDPTKGDYPEIRGEETVWWVFNDAGDVHGETGGQPLNVEVKAMAYALNSPAYLQHTTFYRFEVTNYGSDLDSVFLGMQVDVDLGDAFDDYVGCDTVRNMGVGYNGDSVDGPSAPAYGPDPPLVGVDFLRSPIDQMGSQLGMTSFMAYDNDFSNNGNPEIALHYYRYLQARYKDNSPLMHNGKVVKHMFPSEPNESNGWSECTATTVPFDRRFVMGSGPFTLAQGESKTLDVAALWNRCIPLPICPPFDCIQTTSDAVQAWFDASYPLVGIETNKPKGHASLQIHPNPSGERATVSWGDQLSEESVVKIYDIKGVVVYQAKVQSGDENHQFSTSNFEKGIYLIQLVTSNGKTSTGKMMVTH